MIVKEDQTTWGWAGGLQVLVAWGSRRLPPGTLSMLPEKKEAKKVDKILIYTQNLLTFSYCLCLPLNAVNLND